MAAAWSITGSDEVFVAKRASSLATLSTSPHISSFCGEVLGDRLDHQVAVGQVRVVERALDPAAHGVGVALLHLALLDGAAQLLLDLAEALVERVLVDLAHHDVVSGLRRDLSYAVAHQPAADHSDLLDLH